VAVHGGAGTAAQSMSSIIMIPKLCLSDGIDSTQKTPMILKISCSECSDCI
jgi:hypothetical protein